jgi:hypothetical protein
MWGSATFAMLVSSTSIKAASDTTNAISQGFAFGFQGTAGREIAEGALIAYLISVRWVELTNETIPFVSIVQRCIISGAGRAASS